MRADKHLYCATCETLHGDGMRIHKLDGNKLLCTKCGSENHHAFPSKEIAMAATAGAD